MFFEAPTGKSGLVEPDDGRPMGNSRTTLPRATHDVAVSLASPTNATKLTADTRGLAVARPRGVGIAGISI